MGFARRTRPDRIIRDTLYVVVASAGWSQELAMHEKIIVARLKERGIDIAHLRFKVGEVEPIARGGVHAPSREELARARSVEAPEEARATLEKVSDVALRASLEKAARAAARQAAEIAVAHRAERAARKPRTPGRG
ncbi:MAG: hypothetical protein NVS3B20_11610 [Polyangiales bacterium]